MPGGNVQCTNHARLLILVLVLSSPILLTVLCLACFLEAVVGWSLLAVGLVCVDVEGSLVSFCMAHLAWAGVSAAP